MKPPILLLLLASLNLAGASEPEREVQEIEKELGQIRTWQKEDVAELEKLRSLLTTLPGNSSEAASTQEKINELQIVLKTLSEGIEKCQERLGETKSSPLYLAVSAMATNKRHPTKSNISGVWISSFNIGYIIELEQSGRSVSGVGYYHGCMGPHTPFQVTGVYKAGLLTLTFTLSPKEHEKHLYRYTEERHWPIFQEEGTEPPERVDRLFPYHQMH